MTKPSFSLADFTPSQADRFRGYRYGLIGVWDPAYPRWMPNYKDAYLVYTSDGDQKSGRYLDADGKEHWIPRAIFDKMHRAGLLEETEARTDVLGKALTYSGWGLDFLITGHTDLTSSPPIEVMQYLRMIRDRADEEFYEGTSRPFILRERNSTLIVDEIDTPTGADRIGMLVTPEATIAVAYDKQGLRITDVLVEHDFRDPFGSWLEPFVFNPASRRPITVEDLEPGIRLADLFNVPRESIHQDEAILDDIMQRRTCIFNPRRGVIPQVRADVVVHRPPGPAH